MCLEVLIMGKINCRGHEKRIALCELYDIKPEFRIKQLSGITISDSGGRITDELYIFSAFSKQDGSFYDKIICGEPTAKDFLMITGADRPPLFNMLKSVSKPTKEKSSKEKKSSSPSESTNAPMYSKEDFSEWHPVNKALYNAIMILIICWGDVSGDSVLFKQRNRCIRYKGFYPYSDRIMSVNTMIGKSRHRTLAGILEYLKEKGNDIKDFTPELELLHEAVLKCGVASNIM